MATDARPVAKASPGPGLDPFRAAWNLLTNVKFALLLVGTATAAGLVGVVIPQVPAPMRSNPAAKAAWLELQRHDYGSLTTSMDRLGLFDVFHTAWFNGLWIVIVAAVTVCTVSRFMPTARSVHRPPRTVGDGYFEAAHHRASFSHAGGAEAIERELRRRRYRVERTAERGGATYLFAERFAWSQYGTFVSHLALLMLLVGGLLTKLVGFDRTLALAETASAAPVFTDPGPGQIFVRMVDAYRGQDGSGNIVDYHSIIEVRRGDEAKTCKTTVNDPCHAFGYKIHQAAFFDDIGRLRVTGPDGRVLFDDVLDFNAKATAVPHIVARKGAATVFDAPVAQTGTIDGGAAGAADDIALGTVRTSEGDSLLVGWRVVGGTLKAFLFTGSDGLDLAPGVPVTEQGLTVEMTRAQTIPAITIDDMPGAADGRAVIQMPVDSSGAAFLVAAGIDEGAVVLREGANYVSSQGYGYTFGGRIEASGVSVRRDPGDTFIWIAVAMAMLGLGVTFYVPRRRLWVRVTPGRTWMAGQAERTTRFGRELRQLGVALGSTDALRPEDLED
ncbi:MAG: cytochrome c biogenesis protein ResB [Chloroflexi bacterium]|nr:cytochrome c biogenesis protein ResB [Chloroflexota bacterium]